jgi:hypothetical protein
VPSDPREEFAAVLRELGGDLSSDHPIMDGRPHRMATLDDDRGEKCIFYVGHLDGRPAAYAKNNRSGEETRWKSSAVSMSKEQFAAVAPTKIAEREADRAALYEHTAQRLRAHIEAYPALSPPSLLPMEESRAVDDPLTSFLAIFFAIWILVFAIVVWIQEQKRRGKEQQEKQAKRDRERAEQEQNCFREAAHQVNLALIRAGGDPFCDVPMHPKTMQEVLDSLPELVWKCYLLVDAAVTLERHLTKFLVHDGCVMTRQTYQWEHTWKALKEKEVQEEKRRWEENEQKRADYLDGQSLPR